MIFSYTVAARSKHQNIKDHNNPQKNRKLSLLEIIILEKK